MKVSVVGLGKLGASLAAAVAHRGHEVVGVDLDASSVQKLNDGVAPVRERGLAAMIAGARARLRATTDLASAVAETEATFVVVPTPSAPDGSFALDAVLAAMTGIGEALAEKSSFHLVVLSSTVSPRHMEERVLPALERASGKRCGVDFGLCYNPAFIALGNVLAGILRPDFVLIGESDARSGEMLASFHRSLCERDVPIARMLLVEAELVKLSVNTFVTTKISFANTLAAVCERLPGARVDVVTAALGLDPRIGARYLKGGLGYGGPCFPRDNAAFVQAARALGVEAPIAEATDAVNRRQVPRLLEMVTASRGEGGAVAVLGLSYKPDTGVVTESQGVELARALAARGVPIAVYDPAAEDEARAALAEVDVRFASSVSACVTGASVVVVTTPWPEFREIAVAAPATVIDCWRCVDASRLDPAVTYVALGVAR